ncbi:hypothetical protein SM11_pC1096 (plasmid) [Sinorhizobium meliloti SM11]|uniref:Transposase IS66 central domain-containing protein n=1 Tax=Sinorhizobium meliloti (strain SM11) TaxID=707241 RepID=F7XF44_SINMM|nr:hypothetical protein SM11_pC1096 [Sinorhizobium meliloti SM11]
MGCSSRSHSRRRFIDALKTRKKGGGPPEQALKFFEQLYRIESQAKNEKPEVGETQADCIRRFRQQHSVPILIALKHGSMTSRRRSCPIARSVTPYPTP